MFEANTKELEFINKRYNDIKHDIYIGTDYVGEGLEVFGFSIDDNGRTRMDITEYYLNNQYALRMRWHERHPRLKSAEIDYLLGRTNSIEDDYNFEGTGMSEKDIRDLTVEEMEELGVYDE